MRNWMLGLSLANGMFAVYNLLAGQYFLGAFNLGAAVLCWPGKERE